MPFYEPTEEDIQAYREMRDDEMPEAGWDDGEDSYLEIYDPSFELPSAYDEPDFF